MVEALESGIKALDDVEKVRVYENRTNAPDSNGILGKGMHIFVRGGIDQEIFERIFLKYGFGPSLEGAVSGTVYSENNNPYVINFDNVQPSVSLTSTSTSISTSVGRSKLITYGLLFSL